jgi:predicted MFS family arabinose efflux permease
MASMDKGRPGGETAGASAIGPEAGQAAVGGPVPVKEYSRLYRWWLLALIMMVAAFAYIDRVIIQTLGQPIKEDLNLSDFQLGLLGGLGFALLYSTLGLPIARLAERHSRISIISISVAVFSGMAALCGMAANFWQLLLFRIGVGIGEAGVQAPSVSLLGDHFPPEKRGRAVTMMRLGAPVGSVLGAIIGGYIAHNYGWRAAVISLAVPGLIVALLFKLTLREPRRGMSDPDGGEAAKAPPPPFLEVMRTMWVRPEFRHMLIGLALATMGLYASGAFLTPFLIRVHGLTVAEAGIYFGLLSGIGGAAGFILGGLGVDIITRRGARWYALLPAIGLACGVPFYLIGYSLGDPRIALVLFILGGMLLFFHSIPTLVAFQNMVGPRMRATAAFVFFFISTMVGIGLGPPVLGLVSDLFGTLSYQGADFAADCPGGRALVDAGAEAAARCSEAAGQGVQYALMAAQGLYVWGAIHYLIASRRIDDSRVPPPGAPAAS